MKIATTCEAIELLVDDDSDKLIIRSDRDGYITFQWNYEPTIILRPDEAANFKQEMAHFLECTEGQ